MKELTRILYFICWYNLPFNMLSHLKSNSDVSVLAFPTLTSLEFATRHVNQSKPFPDGDFCGDSSFVSGPKCKRAPVVIIGKHFLPIFKTFFCTCFGAARP